MKRPSLLFKSDLIVPGSRVCVAISGGADSVALLCALYAANQTSRASLGIGLSAVHVNHGLRGEDADADEAFVRSLCDRLQIPLQIHHVDVPAYRSSTGQTLEEAARTLRYEVFHAVLSSRDIDDLATAHTLDDQAETVIMKLLRGAWTEGLSGISPALTPIQAPGKRILRPLLGTSRAEVLNYLRESGQAWREDITNLDITQTRNRLRHHVLPLLRQENPALSQTLGNLAELAREEEERWQNELARLLPQLLLPGDPVRGGGRSVSTSAESSVALEIERLRRLDKPTLRRVLRAAARSVHRIDTAPPDGSRLSFDETNRLIALCGFQNDATVASRPGTILRLNQSLMAKRSARELKLFLTTPFPAKIRLKQ